MNRGPRGFHGRPRPSVKNLKRTIKTLLRYILKDHPVALFVVIICIIIGSLSGVVGSMFLETLFNDYIKPLMAETNPNLSGLIKAIAYMAGI